MFVYFSFIIFLIGFALIFIAFYRYMHYQKNAIIFETQKARGLKYFTNIFCEYNWKIPGKHPRLLFQLSLARKVFQSFKEEDSSYRQQKYVNQLQQFLKDILFFIVYLGTIGGSGYFLLALHNNRLFDKNITDIKLLNECVISSIVIYFIEIVNKLLLILSKLLQHFEKKSDQQQSEYSKCFLYQSMSYAIYVFIRSSVTYPNERIISSIIDTAYSRDGYTCPQQSSAQALLSLYLMHMLFILYIKQYFLIIMYRMKKGEQPFQKNLKSAQNNQGRRQFKIIENTIPIIISNMIVLMNTPYNFSIYPISLVLSFFYFFHNFMVMRLWKFPEYLTISSITTHGILVMMYLFCLFLNFIHFFFISSVNQPLFYFLDDSSRICGPFSDSSTSILSFIFSSLIDKQGFQDFIDIIFWRPLLICILSFFLMKNIANRKQYSKWLSILRSRSKELNAVKKHYKKKVNKLIQQLDMAAKDIKAIQNDNGAPQVIKPSNYQTMNKDMRKTSLEVDVKANLNNSGEKLQTGESYLYQGVQHSFNQQRKRSTFNMLQIDTSENNHILPTEI